MSGSVLRATDNKMEIIPYEKVSSIFGKRAKLVSAEYAELLELTKEGISLNFSLSDSILKTAYESALKTGMKLDDFHALKPIIYHKSIYFLNSALFLFENGHIYATYSCLRTVLEHIWRLYFLTLAPEECGNLWYKFEVKQLSNDEKKHIKEKFRFFSAAYMRDFLYEKNKKTMKVIYEQLSQRSHPSITGAMEEIEFRKTSTDDLAKLLPTLGLGLLLVGHEISPDSDQIDKSVNNYMRLIGTKLGSIPGELLPDKPTLTPHLRIKLQKIL